jgi:restriction endonuclease/calcineurin-like phosphoesterase family protein
MLEWSKLNSSDFERLCFKLVSKEGFENVKLYAGSGDRARDIVAEYFADVGGSTEVFKFMIQCKRIISRKTLGISDISSLKNWMDSNHGFQRALIITSADVSPDTRDWLDGINMKNNYKIDIWDKTELEKRITKHHPLLNEYFGIMPSGKQAGDYSPIVQLSAISNINEVAIVGNIDITDDSTKVINKMKQNSQILFLNGDFSYSEDEHDTRHWYSSLFTNYNGQIFGSLGNHDLSLGDVYKELFNQGQWTYSIDIGNVHFLILNTQRWSSDTRTSSDEIGSDIDAAIGRGMKFLIILQHVALKGHVKTSSKYYYVKISDWEDVYKDKRVELIISAHARNYQRFPKNTDGNIYLTVGTGGAEFTVLQSTSGLAKYFKNIHGYLMIENIGQESLNIRFLDKMGIELDSFTVTSNR